MRENGVVTFHLYTGPFKNPLHCWSHYRGVNPVPTSLLVNVFYLCTLWLFPIYYSNIHISILHGVDPLSYFSFQPVFHNWCNKGCGMCYPVCGMVHIKEPLLLIGQSSLCGGFPLSLSEWSFNICLMPYNCE